MLWSSLIALASAEPVQIQPHELELHRMRVDELVAMSPPPVSYQMTYRTAVGGDYSDWEIDTWDGWVEHAMRWKSYVANEPFADIDAYRSLHGSAGWVECSDTVIVNDAEEMPGAFPSYWSPTNPVPGVWLCEQPSFSSDALVFAAFAMHYWGTPVYYDTTEYSGGHFRETSALQRITFNFPSGDLFDYCFLSPSDPPMSVLNAVLNGQCATFGAPITAVEISSWSFSAGFIPDEIKTAATVTQTMLPWQGLIFDPPEEASAEDVAALMTAAQILGQHVLVENHEGVLVHPSELTEEDLIWAGSQGGDQ